MYPFLHKQDKKPNGLPLSFPCWCSSAPRLLLLHFPRLSFPCIYLKQNSRAVHTDMFVSCPLQEFSVSSRKTSKLWRWKSKAPNRENTSAEKVSLCCFTEQHGMDYAWIYTMNGEHLITATHCWKTQGETRPTIPYPMQVNKYFANSPAQMNAYSLVPCSCSLRAGAGCWVIFPTAPAWMVTVLQNTSLPSGKT